MELELSSVCLKKKNVLFMRVFIDMNTNLHLHYLKTNARTLIVSEWTSWKMMVIPEINYFQTPRRPFNSYLSHDYCLVRFTRHSVTVFVPQRTHTSSGLYELSWSKTDIRCTGTGDPNENANRFPSQCSPNRAHNGCNPYRTVLFRRRYYSLLSPYT